MSLFFVVFLFKYGFFAIFAAYLNDTLDFKLIYY